MGRWPERALDRLARFDQHEHEGPRPVAEPDDAPAVAFAAAVDDRHTSETSVKVDARVDIVRVEGDVGPADIAHSLLIRGRSGYRILHVYLSTILNADRTYRFWFAPAHTFPQREECEKRHAFK
jgi:hypothetical protein